MFRKEYILIANHRSTQEKMRKRLRKLTLAIVHWICRINSTRPLPCPDEYEILVILSICIFYAIRKQIILIKILQMRGTNRTSREHLHLLVDDDIIDAIKERM